jgi:hypothetical protein
MFLPAPGPPAADPSIRTGRITVQPAGTDRMMQRDSHALISTPVGTSVSERSHIERLSLRAAIFWIGVLSLGGWTVIIALVIALD